MDLIQYFVSLRKYKQSLYVYKVLLSCQGDDFSWIIILELFMM